MSDLVMFNWLGVDNWIEFYWVFFGFFGQLMFSARFLIQWIATERSRQSVVPTAFWWFSIAGGLILFAYAVYRRDPVFILGQSMGVLIYSRNLWFIYFGSANDRLPSSEGLDKSG